MSAPRWFDDISLTLKGSLEFSLVFADVPARQLWLVELSLFWLPEHVPYDFGSFKSVMYVYNR